MKLEYPPNEESAKPKPRVLEYRADVDDEDEDDEGRRCPHCGKAIEDDDAQD